MSSMETTAYVTRLEETSPTLSTLAEQVTATNGHSVTVTFPVDLGTFRLGDAVTVRVERKDPAPGDAVVIVEDKDPTP